ncbi:hypothetical protein CL634_01260 [bacterium]|nr:hypothetical protein [bacterium]
MSQHRTWDENRSPQWKYLFQKEALRKRKTRRDLDKELRENIKEQEEEFATQTKFGKNIPKRRVRGNRKRKVTKEELQNKLQKAIEKT